MSAIRRTSGLIAFALLLATGTAWGQTVQTTAGFTSLSDGLIIDPNYGQHGQVQAFSPVGTRGGYLWVEGVFGDRPFNEGNYFDVGAFMPGPRLQGGMMFADVQILGDEHTRIGIDANIGFRRLIADSFMFGAHGSYTHDHSFNEYAYDWIGGGVEVAFGHLQVSSNSYIPVGNQQNPVGPRIETDRITVQDRRNGRDVVGSTIGFLDMQRVEQNMRGLDANLTFWVPNLEWLYGGAGVYHFNAKDGENASGYRVRGGVDFNSLQVNVAVSNDSLFGTATDVSVTYFMGRGDFSRGLGGQRALDQRMYDRVVKQRRIATTTFLKDVFTPADDGKGGTLDIVYVRNNNIRPGDGSFGNPFNRLDFANGTDADIIGVLRGSTGPATFLQAGDGLVLRHHQRVLGDGIPHIIDIPDRGVFLVPGLDPMGTSPVVTGNPGTNIITIASKTEVNSLNMVTPDSGAAIGNVPLTNFILRNLNKDVPNGQSTGPGSGILLANVQGEGIVQNVRFNTNNNAALGGLRIGNNGMSALNLLVDNVQFNGGQVGIDLFGLNSEINANITGAFTDDNAAGLLLRSNGSGELNINVEDSQFVNARNVVQAGSNVFVLSDSGLTNLALTNVTGTGAGRNGFSAVLTNDARLNMTATDSDFSGAGMDGISFNADDSDVQAFFLRTIAQGAGRDGINIFASNTADVDVLVRDGNFMGAGRDATHTEAINLSTIDLVVDPTPSTGAGRHGYFFNAQGDSQINTLFENSNLSGPMNPTGSHAIFGTLGGGSIVNLTLNNSNAAVAGGNALLVNATGNSIFNGTFLDSILAGAGANALEINLDSSEGTLQVSDSNAAAATDSGLVVNATNGSEFTGTFANGSLSDTMNGDGIRMSLDDSDGTLGLLNTPVTNAADNAFEFNLANSSTLGFTIVDSDLSGAGSTGILGMLDGGSSFNGSVTNGSIENAGGDAVSIALDNSSDGVLILDGAPGNGAAGNGLSITADNGSTFAADLSNGTTFDTVGDTPIRAFAGTSSTVNIVGDGVSGMMAGIDGINLDAQGGTINLLLTNTGDFSGAGADGIDVNAIGGTVTVDISGGPALFEMATDEGLEATLFAGSNATFNLTGVSLNNAGLDAVEIEATDSMFTAAFDGSSFNNAGDDAFDFELDNSTGTATINNSVATTASVNAVEVEAMNGSGFDLQMTDVTLDGALDDIIDIEADASTVIVTGVNVSGAGAGNDAIEIDGDNGTFVQLDLSGTMMNPASFDGAAADGVDVDLTGGSTGIVNLTDTSFTGLGGDTFMVNATDSAFSGNITRTDFTGANNDAVDLNFDNSFGTLVITESLLDMAGDDGVDVEAVNLSFLDIDLIDSSVMNAGDDAYDIDFSGGSFVDLFVDPTDSTGAGDNGFQFSGDGVGSGLVATFIDSDLSTAANPVGNSGVNGILNNGATASVTLDNSDIAGAGDNGMIISAMNGSGFAVSLDDVDASGAGLNGIRLVADAGSTGSVSALDVNANGASDTGLNLEATDGSSITGNVQNLTADGAGNEALELLASTNSSVIVTGDNVSGFNAGLDAISVRALGGSSAGLNLTNAGSFADAGRGLFVEADGMGSISSVVLSGTGMAPVSFDDAADTAIDVLANNGGFAGALLTNVTAMDAGNDGLRVNATDAAAIVDITNGNLNGAGNGAGDHGVQLSFTNSAGIVDLTNASVDGAFEDAFNISTTAGSDLDMKLTTVTAIGPGDDVFDLSGTTLGTLMLDIDPNDLTGAGNNTFEFNFDTGAVLTVMVADSPMSTQITPVGNNVIQGVLNSGAKATFDVINSEMTFATNDAVNIVADGMDTMFMGRFDATSDMHNAGGNALDLTGSNGAMIGIMAEGVSFDGAMGGSAILGNFDGGSTGLFDISNFSADMSGNIGLELTADNDSLIAGSFTNGSFDMHASHGIKLSTNPDMSLNDNSLIDLDFDMVTADGNFGDGMNAMAFNGNDMMGQPQMTGIIVDFANGSLSNNSNMNLGDGIGYGVSGMADGDGSGPQNTRVTFNFVNTDIVNNEEGAFNRVAVDGGAVDFSFTGGMIGGANGLVLCADGPLDVFNFTLNGTMIGNNPTGPGLLVKAINDGTVNANISNIDLSNNGEEGVRFLANTGGNIGLVLQNVDVMSNGTTGSFDGIYGTVGFTNQAESLLTPGKFATVEFDLINVNIGDNPESALDVDVASGGIVSNASNIVGGTFSGNSTGGVFDEVEYFVNGPGSHLGSSFDGTSVDGAVGNAFSFIADDMGGPVSGGNLAIGLNNVSAQNAGGDALSVLVDNASLAMSVTGFDGSGAVGQGADFDILNTAVVSVNNFNNVMLDGALGGDALEVTVNNAQLNAFSSSNLNVLNSANTGIDIDAVGSVANFSFDGVMADDNDVHGLFAVYTNSSSGSLSVNNITATNHTAGAPFVARVLNDSHVDISITNGTLMDSSVFVNNVEIQAANNSTANVMINNVMANGPMLNGIVLDYSGSSMGNISVMNSSATTAQLNGLLTNITGGSNVTALFDGLMLQSTVTGDGALINVTDSTADLTLNNVTATGVAGNGVSIFVDPSTVTANLSNINVDGAMGDGVVLSALDSVFTTNVNGVTANNVGGDGLAMTADNSTLTADVANVSTNMADGRGVFVSVTNGSTADVNSFDNISATSAGMAGIDVDVAGSQLQTFNGSNVTASSNGRLGVADGIDISVDGVGALADVDITGFTANLNSGDGVSFLAGQMTAGATLNLDLTGGSAGLNGTAPNGNGVIGRVSGAGTTANVLLDGVSANTNQENGADLGINTGATLNVTLNNGTSASSNINGAGVVFNADGAGTMASLTSTSGTNQFMGNALGGVDVNLTGTATATDVTIVGNASSNGGDGINVTTDASGVTLNNLQLTNGALAANNNLGTGIVIDLDNVLGLPTIDVSNFSVTGNQGVANPRGVAGIDVSLTNMTFASVTMDNLNVSGNPGGTGIGVLLDAATVTGNVQLTNFTAGNNGGTGADVELLNASSVDTLTVSGSASGNLADGIRVAANDGSAHAINNLLIGGMAFSADNNGGTGLIVDLDSVTGLQMLDVSGLGVTGNSGAGNPRGIAGIDVVIANMTLDTVNMANLAASANPGGTGIGLLLDNAVVSTAVDLSGFVSDNNGGGGTSVDIRNGSNLNSLSVNGSASGNLGGDGLSIVSTVGAPATINNFSLAGAALNLNNNTGNGLTVDFDGVLGLSDFGLNSLTVTGNTQDQINVRLANMVLDTVTMNDIVATGPGAMVGIGDGIELTFDSTTVNDLLRFERITSTDNGEDGLQLTYLNGSMTPVGMPANSGIDVGIFDNNGQSGVHVMMSGGSSGFLELTNSTALITGTTSSASGNLLRGLNVALMGNSSLTMSSVDRQFFDNNGGAGVFISGSNSDFFSGNSFTNNSMSNNGSFGFFSRFLNGAFDIALGTVAPDGMGGFIASEGNLIDNNVGAGVAVEMIQATTGRLIVAGSQITNTADDGNAMTIYQGDGVVVSQLGTSNPAQATNTLTDAMGGPGLLIQDNVIGVDMMGAAAANAGHGVTFQLEEESVVDGLIIDGNMIGSNGIDGVNMTRFDSVEIIDFEITDNLLVSNSDDAIHITGENDGTAMNLVMDVTIADNDIMMSGDNGIELLVNADAGLMVDILRNNIIGNGDDGINVTEIILDPSDFRMVSGMWNDNVIANNADRGIFSSAQLGFVSASNNIIGAVLDGFGQVLVNGNGNTGVEINGSGFTTTSWTSNTVIQNGGSVMGNRAVGHGFDFQGGPQDITLTNNLIRENFQDGIEMLNNDTSYTVTMTDNRVQNNNGRGLDLLTRLDGLTTVNMLAGTFGNIFNSNLEEGIYVVNTSSGTQNQTDFASAMLQSNGGQDEFARTSLLMDNITVANNGDVSTQPNLVVSAGLVVRSGTTAGPGSVTTGFAGNAPSNTSVHFATDQSGNPTFVNSGIFARLTNSTFGGNFGDDVFFHGFVSTGTPGGVTGTWDDMQFAPMGAGNTDTLARLDLVIGTLQNGDGNIFDSVNFTNPMRQGTPNGEAGAFFNDADGTFKSRESDATPPGPFNAANGANRRRNAQRTPIRAFQNGTVLAPDDNGLLPFITTDSGQFQFPGMGDSTFRVRATSGNVLHLTDLNNNGVRDAFEAFTGFGIFDDDVLFGGDFGLIEANGEQRGVGFTGGTQFGELPFGWGTF